MVKPLELTKLQIQSTRPLTIPSLEDSLSEKTNLVEDWNGILSVTAHIIAVLHVARVF